MMKNVCINPLVVHFAATLALLAILLPFTVVNAFSSPSLFSHPRQVSSGNWQPGTFEIHIFDIEQGDSHAIACQENLLQLFITIETYDIGRMGSLAKRVIVDRRGVKI